MSQLFFQLYNPCGIFNQVTSLELGVGLSEVLGKQLVIHNVSNPPNGDYGFKRVPIYSANHYYNSRSHLIDVNSYERISDLMDWDGKENTILIDGIVTDFTDVDNRVEDLMEYYIPDYMSSKEDQELFSEGRKSLLPLSSKNLSVSKTLGYYSRFFMNRSKSLDSKLSSVRFKQEYHDLAKKIAESIGDFNGAHLRLTDHTIRVDTQQEMFDRGIDSLGNNKKIVLCTDNGNSDVVRNSPHEFVMLDDLIINNFLDDFKQLRFKDEISFGILNNLVMHYSDNFIGTAGSTFTGYIQRSINQNRDVGFKLFNEQEPVQSGTYSWNGHHVDTITKQWWREWKESRLK